MPYEIEDWKEAGCSVDVEIVKLSTRAIFSEEINKKFGEGGALNANYQTVEAIAVATNMLGLKGLEHGEDFIFKTAGLDKISFDFCNKATKKIAEEALNLSTGKEVEALAEEKLKKLVPDIALEALK